MEASCSLSSLIQHRQEMQLRQPLEHRAWHAEEAISAQKRGYYVTRVQLGLTWVALHLAGEEGWGRGMLLKSRVLFPFFTGSCSEQKATSKILSIKLPGYSFKLHLNENEDHYSTWELKSLLSLWLSLPLSVFPSRSLSSLPSLRWYLHVNDFCISAFLSPSLFFFATYLHVSGFRCLMVLRCNESNLLCDSQTILPAITLIHSGQWILMTMKPGSCEDILQAPVLVTLVRLSCGCGRVPFTSKRV